MIFMFSGTGNSLYAAKKLSDALGDHTIIDMAAAVNSGDVKYSVSPGESVGFVFPAYYETLPATVRRFIEAFRLCNISAAYVWAVITCGSEMMTVPKFLSEELEKKGIALSAVYELKMPDNYVILYNPASQQSAAQTLKKANEKLPLIADKIRSRAKTGLRVALPENAVGTVMAHLYDKWRKTKKFRVNDRCISCGLCETICPEKAIEINNGKPCWVKDKCAHCVGCISRCPVFAIEYGKQTEKRRRYINPVF